MKRGIIALIGFLIFATGLLALLLSLVGIQFSFLTWIDKPSPMFGFLMRLAMIIVGLIIFYLAQTNFGSEQEE